MNTSAPGLPKSPVFKLKLVENLRARSICETKPRYDLYLNEAKIGQLDFNMRGYCGALLPQPDSEYGLDIGECSISAWRKEIARLNRTPVTVTRFYTPSPELRRACGI